MNEQWLNFLLIALASWRVSNLLVNEDGPNLCFRKLRERTGIIHDENGNKIVWSDTNPLHCIMCTSLYVAPVLYLISTILIHMITILAISAVVCLIDKAHKNG